MLTLTVAAPLEVLPQTNAVEEIHTNGQLTSQDPDNISEPVDISEPDNISETDNISDPDNISVPDNISEPGVDQCGRLLLGFSLTCLLV